MHVSIPRPPAIALGVLLLGAMGAAGSAPPAIPPEDLEPTALRLEAALGELRADPRALGPHLDLGETYYALGNVPAARHHLETFLAAAPAGPDSVRAAYLHARTLLRAGMRLRATQALRALAGRPGVPPDADHDLSLLLRADGFAVEAVMAEMRALEGGGGVPERLREAAHQWKELGRPDQAAATYAKLVAGSGQVTAEDWFQFGYLAHRTNRFDVARTAYEACLALDAGHPEAHFNAALVAQREDRGETATFHFEQVLRLRPDYEPAYFELARLFLSQERTVEAAAVFRRYLAVSTDSLAMAETRSILRDLSGER
jgi:tetratricopeptide (TPR) repeat protein